MSIGKIVEDPAVAFLEHIKAIIAPAPNKKRRKADWPSSGGT